MRFPRVMTTGHRPNGIPLGSAGWVERELERLAVKLRDQNGMQVGISGMALGSDIWWAQATVFAWQELWAFLPFPQQAERWTPEQVALWQEMRSRATRERITADSYSREALLQRNEDMLDYSDLVIAVFDPTSTGGGTLATVRSAVRRMLPIIHVNPVTQSTMMLAPGRIPA